MYSTLIQGIRQSAETEKNFSTIVSTERVKTDGLTSFKDFQNLLSSLLLNKDYRQSCSSNTSPPHKSSKLHKRVLNTLFGNIDEKHFVALLHIYLEFYSHKRPTGVLSYLSLVQ